MKLINCRDLNSGIVIDGLGREFNGKSVFKSSSLRTHGTGLVNLQGPNGSGKTTLLRILATLLAPSEGEAWIQGLSVVKDSIKVRKIIGFVPASDGGFLRRLTGRENLFLFGRLRGLKNREIGGVIDQYRESLALDRALETPFALFSSGMRQSLGICRALLHNPTVLILDEPTRSLDHRIATKLRQTLQDLSQKKLIVTASHQKEDYSRASENWELDNGLLCAFDKGTSHIFENTISRKSV